MKEEAMNLVDRVQKVASLAGVPGGEADFGAAYAELLAQLQEALKLMRELALLQVAFLRGQAARRAGLN